MAIIVDTNCFANVFIRNSQKHSEFKPVLDWVLYGKGIFVFGGSKYTDELKKAPKFLALFRLLKECNKVLIGDKEHIDKIQKEIEAKNDDPDFDDPHLPAIVIDTKCRIICSEDKRSIPHVQRKELYPIGFSVPVYFTSIRNEDLLCDKYIDDRLKPLCKMNTSQQKKITDIMSKIEKK